MKKVLFSILALVVLLPGCFEKDSKPNKKKGKKKVALDSGKGIPLSQNLSYDEGMYFDPEVEKFALGEDEFDEARELTVARADEKRSVWHASEKDDLACDAIYFDFDSDIIKEDQQATLAYDVERAKDITEKEGKAITLGGHSDKHFISKTYNIAKSEKRARRVKAELVDAGVDEGKINIVAYGDMKPAVNTSGKERKNRRVEFSEVETAAA
jgi:peptidoglycan-associated lipoprotein